MLARRLTLAITYHDPAGRLYDQVARTLRILTNVFDALVVLASPVANQRSLALFSEGGAMVRQESADSATQRIGGSGRRGTIELALQTRCEFVMYCDGDRAMHWAERYPSELADIARRIPDNDFTVIGRTRRAFESHPRVQRDTEAIVNHVFSLTSGHNWDVTCATRGLSRRAAEAISAGCPDGDISTDVVWPLYLLKTGAFTLGYVEAEGNEFETGDRYADQIAAAGGYDQWLASLDADPRRWAHRLEAARVEVAAMVPFQVSGG